MARHKPDIDQHERALRPSLRKTLRMERRMYASGYRPATLWLDGGELMCIMADLQGAGFDVARGVTFKGIRVAGVVSE